MLVTTVLALRAPTGLTVPTQPPWGSPHLPMAQNPSSAPQGCQPLPQQCHRRDHLQLPTALPWWSMGCTKLGSPMGPHPGPASAWPHEGGLCPGLALPPCPSLPFSWLWDRPRLLGQPLVLLAPQPPARAVPWQVKTDMLMVFVL